MSSSTDSAARDEIEEVIRRHSADLDAEDLRDIADRLETTAQKWEGVSL
ncbi:hypothetical protein [Halolamina rubra]|nr:hypothetical protein [Halolamina rubra]